MRGDLNGSKAIDQSGGRAGIETKGVRLKDVAEHVGISIKTVSNVVNGQHGEVGAQTRERVLAAIAELGYRPHAVAKDLRLRRTNTLGFVSDVVATTPYAGNLIKGALDFASAEKKILTVVDTGKDFSGAEAAIEMMLERRVDAIVYAAMYHRAVQVPDNLREVPAVLLDCYCEDRSLPSVVPDEVLGGYEATESLLRKGHRRIGLINAGHVIPAAVGRLEGYRRALAAYDVPFDRSLVRSGNTMADDGYRHTMDLMQVRNPPTAIFCGTDRTAMGAYQALAELGLSIPGDVAVRGFDDESIIAPYLRPALSTTALPHYEMGRWAVQYLIEHPAGMADPQPVQQKIHCPLVEREST